LLSARAVGLESGEWREASDVDVAWPRIYETSVDVMLPMCNCEEQLWCLKAIYLVESMRMYVDRRLKSDNLNSRVNASLTKRPPIYIVNLNLDFFI
jgi:hypothetical protein